MIDIVCNNSDASKIYQIDDVNNQPRRCVMLRFFTILLFLFFTNAFSNLSTSSSVYHKRLFYTAKVWGYVKYFHSEIAAGNVDWDTVLLSTLPNITPANNEEEFNQILMGMIRSAGSMKIPTTDPPQITDDLKYNLQLDWMSDSIFSDSLKAALDTIKTNFRPQSHYLVDEAWTGGNPTFIKDKFGYSWRQNLYPDKEYRLLALFRYWNILNYFNPYKYILDQNWDSTLVEFIPKMINVSDEISYNLVFLELATRLNDSHAYAYSLIINVDIVGQYYLPIKLKFIENETVVTAVYGTEDIKAGDIIKAINGQDIYSYRDSLRKYVKGSNGPVIERNINRRILRGQVEQVQLTIESQDGEEQISLSREYSSHDYDNLFVKTNPIWEIIVTDSADYGYVDMGRLEVAHIENMFNDLWQTDGIIFDIRNYPNGTMWYMINYLFDAPIHNAKFTVPDIKYPGTLSWMNEIVGSGDFSKTYNNNIYILFDEITQSQAEYTIMAFEQHPQAVKIGSQTSGADGNVTRIYLPGGIYTYFTGLGVFYPDYTETQRIGIVPDIEVHPTIAGIRNGRDELLELALTNPTSIDVLESTKHITNLHLYQNYPNPFNPKTSIKYQIPKSGQVNLTVYNLLGQKVATLVNKKQSAGSYKVEWDASGFASGIYLYKLDTAQDFSKTKKLIVLK